MSRYRRRWRDGRNVTWTPCGVIVSDRRRSYRSPRIRRIAGRFSYYGATWSCGRPQRHDGPHLPRPAPADRTDVLLARWR